MRGRTLGVLTLGLESPARRFDADTLPMVAELATRAATAVDNALLFRKIQDEDQRKNEFLAMLAHELRNPLAPISNAVHILRVSDDEPAKIAWARDVIARQVKQLVRLVDDLLDVSRITRGKIELKIDAVDVAQVVGGGDRDEQAAHRRTPAHAVDPAAGGDAARRAATSRASAQILSNLLNNAAKYTPTGGRISLSAAREGDEVVFRVRDTGVGIPPEFLATIFELFTQVDRTLARSQGGLGIGLTLVRRLVEMQGGTVVARSEGRNRGSEFTVRLPLAAVVRSRRGCQHCRCEPPSPAGLRVLVVDDNRDVADSTASVMRMNGCDVHVAYDGKAAIESVQRLQPDAVLLDIGLPTIDGYLVAEHIRAQPDNGRTMIVAVSGYGQEQDRARSKSVGLRLSRGEAHRSDGARRPDRLAAIVARGRARRSDRVPVAEHGDVTAPSSAFCVAASNRSAIPRSRRRRSPSSPSARSRAPRDRRRSRATPCACCATRAKTFRRGARRSPRRKRYILFESYIVEDDAIGREFAALLAERARAGVASTSSSTGSGAGARCRCGRTLRDAGADVRVFNPPRLSSPLGWLSRDHRKTIVVDGDVGFVSGLCVSERWLGDPQRRLEPWRDTGIEIRGPAVAALEQAFVNVFAVVRRSARRDDPDAAGQRSRRAGTMRLHVIANEPTVAGTFRMDLIVASIARRQLWLTDAYFVATSPYVQALRAAARDGVDVRLLVPGSSDIPALSPLSRAQYRPLLEAGVRVFEWAGTMLHAKTAVADRRWSRVGSTNLNLASWMSNYELDVAIEDAAFSEQMATQYEDDLDALDGDRAHAAQSRAARADRRRHRRDRAARRDVAARGFGQRGSRGGGCIQRRQRARARR